MHVKFEETVDEIEISFEDMIAVEKQKSTYC